MRDVLRKGDYILHNGNRYLLGKELDRTTMCGCLECDATLKSCSDMEEKYGTCRNVRIKESIRKRGNIKNNVIVETRDNVFIISTASSSSCCNCSCYETKHIGCDDRIIGVCSMNQERKIVNIKKWRNDE